MAAGSAVTGRRARAAGLPRTKVGSISRGHPGEGRLRSRSQWLMAARVTGVVARAVWPAAARSPAEAVTHAGVLGHALRYVRSSRAGWRGVAGCRYALGGGVLRCAPTAEDRSVVGNGQCPVRLSVRMPGQRVDVTAWFGRPGPEPLGSNVGPGADRLTVAGQRRPGRNPPLGLSEVDSTQTRSG